MLEKKNNPIIVIPKLWLTLFKYIFEISKFQHKQINTLGIYHLEVFAFSGKGEWRGGRKEFEANKYEMPVSPDSMSEARPCSKRPAWRTHAELTKFKGRLRPACGDTQKGWTVQISQHSSSRAHTKRQWGCVIQTGRLEKHLGGKSWERSIF